MAVNHHSQGRPPGDPPDPPRQDNQELPTDNIIPGTQPQVPPPPRGVPPNPSGNRPPQDSHQRTTNNFTGSQPQVPPRAPGEPPDPSRNRLPQDSHQRTTNNFTGSQPQVPPPAQLTPNSNLNNVSPPAQVLPNGYRNIIPGFEPQAEAQFPPPCYPSSNDAAEMNLPPDQLRTNRNAPGPPSLVPPQVQQGEHIPQRGAPPYPSNNGGLATASSGYEEGAPKAPAEKSDAINHSGPPNGTTASTATIDQGLTTTAAANATTPTKNDDSIDDLDQAAPADKQTSEKSKATKMEEEDDNALSPLVGIDIIEEGAQFEQAVKSDGLADTATNLSSTNMEEDDGVPPLVGCNTTKEDIEEAEKFMKTVQQHPLPPPRPEQYADAQPSRSPSAYAKTVKGHFDINMEVSSSDEDNDDEKEEGCGPHKTDLNHNKTGLQPALASQEESQSNSMGCPADPRPTSATNTTRASTTTTTDNHATAAPARPVQPLASPQVQAFVRPAQATAQAPVQLQAPATVPAAAQAQATAHPVQAITAPVQVTAQQVQAKTGSGDPDDLNNVCQGLTIFVGFSKPLSGFGFSTSVPHGYLLDLSSASIVVWPDWKARFNNYFLSRIYPKLDAGTERIGPILKCCSLLVHDNERSSYQRSATPEVVRENIMFLLSRRPRRHATLRFLYKCNEVLAHPDWNGRNFYHLSTHSCPPVVGYEVPTGEPKEKDAGSYESDDEDDDKKPSAYSDSKTTSTTSLGLDNDPGVPALVETYDEDEVEDTMVRQNPLNENKPTQRISLKSWLQGRKGISSSNGDKQREDTRMGSKRTKGRGPTRRSILLQSISALGGALGFNKSSESPDSNGEIANDIEQGSGHATGSLGITLPATSPKSNDIDNQESSESPDFNGGNDDDIEQGSGHARLNSPTGSSGITIGFASPTSNAVDNNKFNNGQKLCRTLFASGGKPAHGSHDQAPSANQESFAGAQGTTGIGVSANSKSVVIDDASHDQTSTRRSPHSQPVPAGGVAVEIIFNGQHVTTVSASPTKAAPTATGGTFSSPPGNGNSNHIVINVTSPNQEEAFVLTTPPPTKVHTCGSHESPGMIMAEEGLGNPSLTNVTGGTASLPNAPVAVGPKADDQHFDTASGATNQVKQEEDTVDQAVELDALAAPLDCNNAVSAEGVVQARVTPPHDVTSIALHGNSNTNRDNSDDGLDTSNHSPRVPHHPALDVSSNGNQNGSNKDENNHNENPQTNDSTKLVKVIPSAASLSPAIQASGAISSNNNMEAYDGMPLEVDRNTSKAHAEAPGGLVMYDDIGHEETGSGPDEPTEEEKASAMPSNSTINVGDNEDNSRAVANANLPPVSRTISTADSTPLPNTKVTTTIHAEKGFFDSQMKVSSSDEDNGDDEEGSCSKVDGEEDNSSKATAAFTANSPPQVRMEEDGVNLGNVDEAASQAATIPTYGNSSDKHDSGLGTSNIRIQELPHPTFNGTAHFTNTLSEVEQQEVSDDTIQGQAANNRVTTNSIIHDFRRSDKDELARAFATIAAAIDNAKSRIATSFQSNLEGDDDLEKLLHNVKQKSGSINISQLQHGVNQTFDSLIHIAKQLGDLRDHLVQRDSTHVNEMVKVQKALADQQILHTEDLSVLNQLEEQWRNELTESQARARKLDARQAAIEDEHANIDHEKSRLEEDMEGLRALQATVTTEQQDLERRETIFEKQQVDFQTYEINKASELKLLEQALENQEQSLASQQAHFQSYKSNKSSELDDLEQALERREHSLAYRKAEFETYRSNKIVELKDQGQEIAALEQNLLEAIEQCKDQDSTIEEQQMITGLLRDTIGDQEVTMTDLRDQNALLHGNLQDQEATIEEQQMITGLLSDTIADREVTITDLRDQNALLHGNLWDQEATITDLRGQNALLHGNLQDQEATMEEQQMITGLLRDTIGDQEGTITDLRGQNALLHGNLQDQAATIEEQQMITGLLCATIGDLSERVSEQEFIIEQRDQTINGLHALSLRLRIQKNVLVLAQRARAIRFAQYRQVLEDNQEAWAYLSVAWLLLCLAGVISDVFSYRLSLSAPLMVPCIACYGWFWGPPGVDPTYAHQLRVYLDPFEFVMVASATWVGAYWNYKEQAGKFYWEALLLTLFALGIRSIPNRTGCGFKKSLNWVISIVLAEYLRVEVCRAWPLWWWALLERFHWLEWMLNALSYCGYITAFEILGLATNETCFHKFQDIHHNL